MQPPFLDIIGIDSKGTQSTGELRESMKVSYANKSFFGIFLSCMFFSLVALNGCAGLKQRWGEERTRGKEILLAKDVTNVHPFWCGRQAALVYSTESDGIFRHDIETGSAVNVAEWGTVPLSCTPDGEWLVYMDKQTVRHDKGTVERGIVNLWRYEFKTGRRQRFVIANDTYVSSADKAIFPPHELKLYLGGRPNERIKMPGPEWEVVWSQRKGLATVWFSDGSAVFGAYWDPELRKYILEAEVFDPEIRIVDIYPPFKSFWPFLTDKQNRVYMTVAEDVGARIERCAIDLKEKKLSCGVVLKNKHHIRGFDVFSDGETIVFTRDGDWCAKVMRVGEKKAECITTSRYLMGNYVVLSPDDKWMAFTVFRKAANGNYYVNDLYILNLKD